MPFPFNLTMKVFYLWVVEGFGLNHMNLPTDDHLWPSETAILPGLTHSYYSHFTHKDKWELYMKTQKVLSQSHSYQVTEQVWTQSCLSKVTMSFSVTNYIDKHLLSHTWNEHLSLVVLSFTNCHFSLARHLQHPIITNVQLTSHTRFDSAQPLSEKILFSPLLNLLLFKVVKRFLSFLNFLPSHFS